MDATFSVGTKTLTTTGVITVSGTQVKSFDWTGGIINHGGWVIGGTLANFTPTSSSSSNLNGTQAGSHTFGGKAYASNLKFAYTDGAQEIIAKHYYRPINAEILAKNRSRFPDIKLFPVTSFVSGWDEAQSRFFADGAVFDQLFRPRGKS